MKINKLTLALAATIFALSALFTSCSDDSDSAKLLVELPESVGENPFAGHTWKEEENGKVTYYTFEKDTFTIREESSAGWKESSGPYSYNTKTYLLYTAIITYSNSTGVSVSLNDYYSQLIAKWKKMHTEVPAAVINKMASTNYDVYEYNIVADSELKLTKDCFDGNLSGEAHFEGVYLDFGGTFYYSVEENDITVDYSIYPVFEDSSFIGYAYREIYDDKDEMSSADYLGLATGTVTVSGTDGFDNTLKVTFTKLPDGINKISENTEYVLNQESGEELTLTFVE